MSGLGIRLGKLGTKAFWFDLGERALWTAAQAGLGVVTVETFDLPVVYAPVVATVLAALKGYVAGRLGQTGTASTLPANVSPVNPEALVRS